MADPQGGLHCCELCGVGGMPEAELRTHVLLVHVEGNHVPHDLSSVNWDAHHLQVKQTRCAVKNTLFLNC